MNLLCESCGHTWHECFQFPMHMEAFIARLEAACICPNCGFKAGSDPQKGIRILTREDKAVKR